jgi:DNA topoisomerase-1
MKNLVIVESPAKAKTIEGFLGKDFHVRSSFGHIRDLPKGGDAVDIEHGFTPQYVVPDEKKAVVAELKKLTKTADMIWLASDEDREGEAISWHLSQVLGLKPKNTKRIVFHEITKSAIEHAIETPRDIDINLVDAQQARRILDRLVGFELSPILWKKIKPQLSAGRVQSVAVRFLVEREREIMDFAGQTYYKVTAEFETKEGKKFLAEHSERFKSLPDAKSFLEKCIKAAYTIKDIHTRPTKRTPTPPFTTSTLQQEASRKLGYSVSRTMVIAQKLYEAGQITYMRTDSVNLSEAAIKAAASEITRKYGEDHVQIRRYTTKSAGAQEAHEAIRPTHFENHTITTGDAGETRLYELIWKRAIASQMADAQLEKTTVTVGISTVPDTLTANGEVIKFDGFLKVYFEGRDDEDEENMGILPKLTIGENVDLGYMQAMQRFQRPPSRYTEATLVKKLEEHGIGRPSTYAPTISTILKRGYVVKEDREGTARDFEILTLQKDQIKEEKRTEMTGVERGKLFPTDIGMVVTDFLSKYFPNIMDYEFTATVEKEFDDIAEGKLEWQKMLAKFYGPFHKHVEKTEETAERASGERILGKDPKSGKELLVRVGRFGPIAQIGHNTETEKAKFASLRSGQMLETITLEEALELFKLPRDIGKFEDEEMQANIGRFGPYIKHAGKYYSIPKTDDPNTIHEARAIEIIQAKRTADANKLIKSFDEDKEVQVLNGRYGPYIKFGKQNIKIPKETEPSSLTFLMCKELADADAANPKPKRGRFMRKSK